MSTARIICGDARDVLPRLDSADVVMTDPPWKMQTEVMAGNADATELWASVAPLLSARRLVLWLPIHADPREWMAPLDAVAWPYLRAVHIRRAVKGYRSDAAAELVEALIRDMEGEPPRCKCGGALDLSGRCPHCEARGRSAGMDLSASIKHIEVAIENEAAKLAQGAEVDIDKAGERIEKLLGVGNRLHDEHDPAAVSEPAAAPASDPRPVPAAASVSGTTPYQGPPIQGINATGHENPSNTDPAAAQTS